MVPTCKIQNAYRYEHVQFANNDIIEWHQEFPKFDDDAAYYYEYKGQLIYAMIKADNEDAALTIAGDLAGRFTAQNNRIDPPLSAAA